jgi:hypothetical protein
MRRAWIGSLALLLPLLLPAAALARDPGGEFQVSGAHSTYAGSPSVSMDGDGSFVVSWLNGYDVEARRYDPAGQPVGGEFLVGTVGATYTGTTAVTLDRSGFLVVWENVPKYANVYLNGRRLDRAGRPLGKRFTLSDSSSPSVASDPRGNSVTVAQYSDGRIEAIRHNAAGKLRGGPIRVASGGSNPDVTVDAAGNFVVSWNGSEGVLLRRYDAQGAPLGRTLRVTRDEAAVPTLAGNRAGRFAVAWWARKALWIRFYSPSGTPAAPPVRVADTPDVIPGIPSAAMDAEGKVLVTWACCDAYPDSSPRFMFGRWFDASGAPSGGVFPIGNLPQNYPQPAAAAGPKDRFLVVWSGHPASAPPNSPSAILGRHLAFARPGDDPCLLRGGFACDTAHDGGEEELLLFFPGLRGDIVLLGDPDGDGDDDPCRFRDGQFLCDTAHDGGGAELRLAFGQAGDRPLLGDLDGEGRDDACLFRGDQFLCDTAHNGGTAEVVVNFGQPGELAFLGDVDGDGDDDPCVARNGFLLCDTEHDGGAEDVAIRVDFGRAGDVLLLGDVNADGRADPCVHREGRFLCDTRRDGSADLVFRFSAPGATPLLGNVDGI